MSEQGNNNVLEALLVSVIISLVFSIGVIWLTMYYVQQRDNYILDLQRRVGQLESEVKR